MNGISSNSTHFGERVPAGGALARDRRRAIRETRRRRAWSTSERRRSEGAEHGIGQTLGVTGWEFFAEYHATQVERAANEVLCEFEVEVRPDFTALDGPSEHLRAGLSSRTDEALGQDCRKVGRPARLGNQRLDDAADQRVRQDGDRVVGEGQQVAAQAAGVGWEDRLDGVLADQVDEHLLFGGPAAVHAGLADSSPLGNPTHCHARVALLSELGEERGDDRLGLLGPQNSGARRLTTSHGRSVYYIDTAQFRRCYSRVTAMERIGSVPTKWRIVVMSEQEMIPALAADVSPHLDSLGPCWAWISPHRTPPDCSGHCAATPDRPCLLLRCCAVPDVICLATGSPAKS